MTKMLSALLVTALMFGLSGVAKAEAVILSDHQLDTVYAGQDIINIANSGVVNPGSVSASFVGPRRDVTICLGICVIIRR